MKKIGILLVLSMALFAVVPLQASSRRVIHVDARIENVEVHVHSRRPFCPPPPPVWMGWWPCAGVVIAHRPAYHYHQRPHHCHSHHYHHHYCR